MIDSTESPKEPFPAFSPPYALIIVCNVYRATFIVMVYMLWVINGPEMDVLIDTRLTNPSLHHPTTTEVRRENKTKTKQQVFTIARPDTATQICVSSRFIHTLSHRIPLFESCSGPEKFQIISTPSSYSDVPLVEDKKCSA